MIIMIYNVIKVREWPKPKNREIIMNTSVFTVKRINFFYAGTFYAAKDDYIRRDNGYGDGKIIAVADKATAERLAAAIDGDMGSPYYLAHGEYSRPDFVVRRIKNDPGRVDLVSEEVACRALSLDYDLEVA